MKRFVFEGVTDEISVCDCCGKSNLQKTVCFTDNETGEFVYYGSTCAVVHTGGTVADHQSENRELKNKAQYAAMQTIEYKALEKAREKALKVHGPGKALKEATKIEIENFRKIENALIAEYLNKGI